MGRITQKSGVSKKLAAVATRTMISPIGFGLPAGARGGGHADRN